MNKLPLSTLAPIDWRGQTVNVIGGGTSIRGFDFGKLDGIKIGANDSALLLGCDVLFTLDHNFCRRERDQIAEFIAGGGEAIIAHPPIEVAYEPIAGATYVLRNRGQGMSDNPARIDGLHSGHGAINVAFQRRASVVRLLGLDMTSGAGSHWFKDGSGAHVGQRYLRKWAANMVRVGEDCRRAGVHVINYVGRPASAIPAEAFDRRDLAELGG